MQCVFAPMNAVYLQFTSSRPCISPSNMQIWNCCWAFREGEYLVFKQTTFHLVQCTIYFSSNEYTTLVIHWIIYLVTVHQTPNLDLMGSMMGQKRSSPCEGRMSYDKSKQTPFYPVECTIHSAPIDVPWYTYESPDNTSCQCT